MSSHGRPVTIRKSCQFCRTRKIKCSGTARCEACTERNLDCVYAPESAKGRPRRISASAAARAAALMQATIKENEALQTTTSSTQNAGSFKCESSTYSTSDFQRETSLLSSKTVESWTRLRPFMSWNPNNTIAQDIDLFFRQEFGGEGSAPVPENPYLRAISSFGQKMKDIDESKTPATFQRRDLSDKSSNSPASDMSSPPADQMEVQYRAPVMSYDGVLTFMAQEVVEMVAIMYGRLGCQHLEDSAGKFYVKSCLADTSPRMFSSSVLNGTAAQKPSPLARFEQHQIVQMIESWFSLHPLSSIASKTLFLRQFRDGKHDEILLNLMVGDALYIGDGRIGSNAGEPFFEYACALMGARKEDKLSLSVMQSCLLLAWHNFCIGKGRRGTAFASLACAGTNKTLIQLNEKPITGQGMINGVDIGEVETELLKNINCVLSLLTLWGFMQFDTPFADFLPAVPLASESLPSDRRFSKVAELDERSGNLSARRRQDYMIKSWWALRNMTSTCSHIYALYPRNISTALEESKKDDMFWVSVHRLRGINNQNIPLLCLRIRKVLEEAVRSLEAKKESDDLNNTAHSVPVVLYYVIMIHLLFPNVAEEDDWSVTLDTMVKFLETSEFLLGALDRFESENKDAPGDDRWVFSRAMLPPETADIAMANMMLLGIDACGRALEYFIGCVDKGSWQESQVVLAHRARLREVAKALLKAAKYDKLNSARRLKEVKRQVKKVIGRLEEWRVLDNPASPPQAVGSTQQDNTVFEGFGVGTSPAAAYNLAGDYTNAANFDFSNNISFSAWRTAAAIPQHQLPSPSISSVQPSNPGSTSGNSPEFVMPSASPGISGLAATVARSGSRSRTTSPPATTAAPGINIDASFLDPSEIDLAVAAAANIRPEDFQDFSFTSYGTHFPSPETTLWATVPPGAGEDAGDILERLRRDNA
ncbi:hypothetical protein TWF225_006616 [Orbilia oligospora]|uniref:Uncharacterized protein n=1 Tax=Orbilia oligospora TaxID=2813651 RepID=A0A7C8PJF0_ORBOL|nr:hypothetical protein TWF751_007925 [Orbilia oligospora]KAF3181572.1 hypothetical protein TWF225_006616 [Orbilia oligospora]KAF3254307.1 hypothetical protein TWF217_007265 [Orbilia oligospora]KAF3267774.1 hypothetical protein TWF128_009268 [Orbilia oligospora]KAF3298265.1 hypothetical protein TWF132_000097 [Orbilia oligospora]